MIGQPISFDFGKDILSIVIEKIVFPLKNKNSAPLIKNSNIDTFHAVIRKATLNGVELSKLPRDKETSLVKIYAEDETVTVESDQLEQESDKNIYVQGGKDIL